MSCSILCLTVLLNYIILLVMLRIRCTKKFLAASGGEEKTTLLRVFLPKKFLKRGIFMENVAKNDDFFFSPPEAAKIFFSVCENFAWGGGNRATYYCVFYLLEYLK